jgi:aspartokinase/homoserine dehydrogenase 1
VAREAGCPLEAPGGEIESRVPQAVQDAETVDDFFAELKNENAYFEKLRADAEKEGKVLRMIAKLDGDKATIGLQAVTKENPFSTLSGSDNMIVFTTGRYKERPLVVTGPGAGAAVTAAGVFAEIITIGNLLS